MSYNAAISACEKGRHWELALQLLEESKTYCGVLIVGLARRGTRNSEKFSENSEKSSEKPRESSGNVRDTSEHVRNTSEHLQNTSGICENAPKIIRKHQQNTRNTDGLGSDFDSSKI